MDNIGICLSPLPIEIYPYISDVDVISYLDNISKYDAFLSWACFTVPVWHVRSGLVEKDTSYHINVFFEQELKLRRNNNE